MLLLFCVLCFCDKYNHITTLLQLLSHGAPVLVIEQQ